jgi:hypothetical protein
VAVELPNVGASRSPKSPQNGEHHD